MTANGQTGKRANGQTSLEARALDAGYAQAEGLVLRGLDIEVETGEVVALVGPNGSGKSTLLRALGRVLRPKGGVVFLDGRALAEWPARGGGGGGARGGGRAGHRAAGQAADIDALRRRAAARLAGAGAGAAAAPPPARRTDDLPRPEPPTRGARSHPLPERGARADGGHGPARPQPGGALRGAHRRPTGGPRLRRGAAGCGADAGDAAPGLRRGRSGASRPGRRLDGNIICLAHSLKRNLACSLPSQSTILEPKIRLD